MYLGTIYSKFQKWEHNAKEYLVQRFPWCVVETAPEQHKVVCSPRHSEQAMPPGNKQHQEGERHLTDIVILGILGIFQTVFLDLKN